MQPKTFFVEKIVPNLLIWFIAYVVIGKVIGSRFPVLAVDWGALIDYKALVIFMGGVIAAIVVAWIASKGTQLPWLLQKMRDEASSALVNFSSIALVVGGASFDLASVVLAVFGFLVAWRLP